MIHKIQLAHLRVEELIQFLPQLRAQFEGANNLPASVSALLTDLGNVERDIDQLYKRDTAKALTERVMTEDGARDARVSDLFGLVAIHTADPTPEMAEAATRLQRVLVKYGNASEISRANLNAETAMITNLLADLARPEHAADLTTLSLQRWIDALKSANDAVNATVLERAALNADQELPFSYKEKRLEARRIYGKLIEKCLHFADESGNAEPWPGIATKINAITADYDRLIAARKGRAAAKAPAPAS